MEATTTTPQAPAQARPRTLPQRAAERAWIVLSSAFAAFLGLLPHILHHAGPLAGAALFAGAGGSILFGVLGLIAAIPFLLRVHRRCGNWRVPAAILALFATTFTISTLVIGPAINGGGEDSGGGQPSSSQTAPAGHSAHH